MSNSSKVLWSGQKAGVAWEVLRLKHDEGESRFLVNGEGRMQSGISLSGGTFSPTFSYARAMAEEACNDHTNILMLGAGGFCISTCILQHSATAEITVVDTEGWLEEIASQYFFKPKSNRLEFIEGDAKESPATGRFDLILVDLFTATGLVPERLFDSDFIGRLRNLLAPNGSMMWNISLGKEPNWRAIGRKIQLALSDGNLECNVFSHPTQIDYQKCNVLFTHNLRKPLEESGWVNFALPERSEGETRSVVWPAHRTRTN